MVDLIVKRLAKNSTDIKLKTLRVMHFICRRGSVHFRRSMQQEAVEIVRALIKIRGPPHPVHGDA